MIGVSLDDRAFVTSFLVHVIGITTLAFLEFAGPEQRDRLVILSRKPVEPVLVDPEKPLFPDIERFDPQVTVISPDRAGPMANLSVAPPPAPIPPPDPAPAPARDSFSVIVYEDSATANALIEPVDVESLTSSTEAHASVEGAIDRLTTEIQRTARLHPTRVAWLFDASVSLSLQREEVSYRLEKVLRELACDPDLRPVDHVVRGFGERLGPATWCTGGEAEAAGRAVRGIPIDDSGIEHTFGAIRAVLEDHRRDAHDVRLLVVVFTDEVGNDTDLVDVVSHEARRAAASVFVVGAVAPFGEDTAVMPFVEPDARFDQRPRDVRIEQGPETAVRLTLDLVTMPLDTRAIDSGFGPYALSRLCHETQGCYLTLHPDRRPGFVDPRATRPLVSRIDWFSDPVVMAPYRPDYRSFVPQGREIETHLAKGALVLACRQPRLDLLIELKTVFDAPDQGRFAGELGAAQKPAADVAHRIGVIHEILKNGERAATRLEERRWRASYDLAMGRILAAKTRFEAYNRLLGNAKSGLRATHPDTNRWRLEPSPDLHCGDSALERQANTARTYLNRVVTEHPGTPWALVAQAVLEEPLGYRWVEDHYDPPPPPRPADPAPAPSPPADDVPRPRLVPKQPRDPGRI